MYNIRFVNKKPQSVYSAAMLLYIMFISYLLLIDDFSVYDRIKNFIISVENG